jgi:hypothetical protein
MTGVSPAGRDAACGSPYRANAAASAPHAGRVRSRAISAAHTQNRGWVINPGQRLSPGAVGRDEPQTTGAPPGT